MAYCVTFVLGKDSSTGALAPRAIAHLRRALIGIDVAYLRAHPETPAVLESGVQIVDEPLGPEHWSDIPRMLADGFGCLDALACWRAAECFVRDGAYSFPRIVRKNEPVAGCFDGRKPEKCSAAAMHRITFILSVFNRLDEREIAHATIAHMLRALTCIDVDYLRAHPEVPLLYASGVRYEEEPPGQEDWQDIPTSLAVGVADCEDLASWRAAELQARDGILAWPTYLWRHRPYGGLLYHIQTRYPDARVEDPSRRLGMR